MDNREEKRTERIFPSELGTWMTCRKKWLFDYMKRKKKLPVLPGAPAVKKIPSGVQPVKPAGEK